MAPRLFLLVCAIVWLPYGLYCLAQPSSLAATAGVVSASHTGTVELRAMYGGLQAALGVLCLLAVLRADLIRPALICLAFLCSGLALARLSGVAVEHEVSAYTALGLAFELSSAGISVGLLRRAGSKLPREA